MTYQQFVLVVTKLCRPGAAFGSLVLCRGPADPHDAEDADEDDAYSTPLRVQRSGSTTSGPEKKECRKFLWSPDMTHVLIRRDHIWGCQLVVQSRGHYIGHSCSRLTRFWGLCD